jgi:hypothetical protein
MRKPHPIHARMKNGDLCRHISYYRVIRDARPGASPISIHWRCAKLERVSHYMTHPRHTLRVHVTDLIVGWGP